MNNLITKPFTYVANLSQEISTVVNTGVHVFYNYEEDDLSYELIKALYESKGFQFTEHDTSAGGSRVTRDVLKAFGVNRVPVFYFVVNNKIYKYFGPWCKDTIELLYDRLKQE